MDAPQKKNINRWIISAFLMLCLAHLYIPLKIIAQQEAVIEQGKLFRFKVAPLDPNDPFRGKYITLRYDANSVKVKNVNEFLRKGRAYVVIEADTQGYAAIRSISLREPNNELSYVEVAVRPVYGGDNSMLHVEYPFRRFYMEETKAVRAEKMFLESLRDRRKDTWALVSVRGGKAVLLDVFVAGKSLKEDRK